MSEAITAKFLAEKIVNRTLRGIAMETSALVRAGVLPVGTRLPAIRDLAYELGVSPATISEAWSELRQQKIVAGRGRNGTWVCGERFVAKPERLASAGHYGSDVLDLSMAVPDPRLLPPLAEAMAYGAGVDQLNSYARSRIIPELEDIVRQSWPYQPEAFLTTNGGYNAVYTTIRALVRPGAVVAIEHPTPMRLLDILEDLGVRIVPVSCDEEGPLPQSLEAAMLEKPAAFLFQPRLNSVTGQTVSPQRLAILGDILADAETLIIEDDGIADIAITKPVSLGIRFPDRTVHILSYSKTLGPDLRLAVLSSSSAIVEQIQSFRAFSAGWTSRLLQAAAAWLLRDHQTQDIISRARTIYQQRRDRLADELAARGVKTLPGSGLCLWVPVEVEPFAMVTLAARKIAVVPGGKFSVSPIHHIRIATSKLVSDYEHVAESVALAHRV